MEIYFVLTFHVYMDVNSDYKNRPWCWNVIGHVQNSNLNVENTSFFNVENTSFFDVENTSFLRRRKYVGFLRISNFHF